MNSHNVDNTLGWVLVLHAACFDPDFGGGTWVFWRTVPPNFVFTDHFVSFLWKVHFTDVGLRRNVF